MKYALIVMAVMSFLTLLLYASDKSKAKRRKWRTPEKTLLLFSLLGGATGGLCAMILFRHKTKHWYFWLVNYAALAIHLAVLYYTYTHKIALI